MRITTLKKLLPSSVYYVGVFGLSIIALSVMPQSATVPKDHKLTSVDNSTGTNQVSSPVLGASSPEPTESEEVVTEPSNELQQIKRIETTEKTVEQDQGYSSAPVWQQNFKQFTGNLKNNGWSYELNPDVPSWNNEAQAYTNSPNNVRIEPGRGLIIEARRQTYQYPNDPSNRVFQYTSARINTAQTFNFEYGKLEADIKIPAGQGVWPAFWLLSANQIYTNKLNPTESDWARDGFYLHDGEIDIMEYYGQHPGTVEATLQTFNKTFEQTSPEVSPTERFYTYGIEVSPTSITWTINQEPYFKVEKQSSNPDDWPIGNGNKFYILLNLALGGTGGGEIDDSKQSWQMVVEDISFYEYVAGSN